MKKLFTFFTATFFGVVSYAQCIPDITNTVPGLTPTLDNIPCAEQGVAYNQTIQIYVPASAAGFTINSVRVDSIRNFPCGLKYAFNKLDKTFLGGEKGCMQITGTTSDAVGQYRLKVYVTIDVTGLPVPPYFDASLIPGLGSAFNVFLRVKPTAGVCAPIDTMPSPAAAPSLTSSCRYITPDYTNVPNLQNELEQLNISPIPAVNNLNVQFTTGENYDYNYSLTNMVGAVVYSNSISSVKGDNSINVDVSSLTNGIYFLNIRRGDANLTKKIIVSH